MRSFTDHSTIAARTLNLLSCSPEHGSAITETREHPGQFTDW